MGIPNRVTNAIKIYQFGGQILIKIPEIYQLQKIAIFGTTLASLIQRFSTSPSTIHGLLFGHVTHLPTTPSDDSSYVVPTLLATVTDFLYSPSFHESFDTVIPYALHPHSSILAWLSARLRSALRPSMREFSVTSSLLSLSQFSVSINNSNPNLKSNSPEQPSLFPPCVFLLLASPLFHNTPFSHVHTHEYHAFQFFTEARWFEPRSLDIVNIDPAFRGHYGAFSPTSSLSHSTERGGWICIRFGGQILIMKQYPGPKALTEIQDSSLHRHGRSTVHCRRSPKFTNYRRMQFPAPHLPPSSIASPLPPPPSTASFSATSPTFPPHPPTTLPLSSPPSSPPSPTSSTPPLSMNPSALSSPMPSTLAPPSLRGSPLISDLPSAPPCASMREFSVTSSLSSLSQFSTSIDNSNPNLKSNSPEQPYLFPPCVFLLLASPSFDNAPFSHVHTHEYRAFQFRTGAQWFEPRSLDVVNIGPAFRGHYGAFSPTSSLSHSTERGGWICRGVLCFGLINNQDSREYRLWFPLNRDI
ncbi:histone acetyltransferase KAT6A-like [Vigna umbellata]|uniref:histone acetyltransferase KAT6A-like n=1 Tax=Vigna umbellata TaxID=87088 RepID=UPI001F5E6562|nr:histone acetyltransferase KAT6A-like [Vigna umbellata]